MTFSARVNVTGMGAAALAIHRLRNSLSNPRPGLFRATNRLAELWGANFQQEGSQVGGWADLAQMTQDHRSRLGLPPDHPILFRYGALRGVVIEMFATARQNTASVQGDGNGMVGGALTVTNSMADLYVTGWPVTNQWQDSRRPARPFWFVDQNAVAASRSGIEEWLGEVISSLE